MKKYYLMLIILLLFTAAHAQWEKVAIPNMSNGTSVLKMYYDGNILWAGGIGQIFKSEDQGSTWTEASGNLQSGISGVSGFTKLGDRVYVSFSGNGDYYTYYTTNNGQNWNLDTAGWSGVAGVLPAAVQLHTHKNYVLARLESNFILYKTNTDASWSVLNVPSSHRTPGYVYSVGDTLVLGASYVALSVDMGANWTIRQSTWPAGLPLGFVNGMHQDKANPLKLFANYTLLSNSKSTLFVSTNNQVSWDSISMPVDRPELVTAMHVNGNNVYAAYAGSFTAGDTLKKFFRSTDGGTTWNNITGNLYSHAPFKFHSIYSIQVFGNNIYAGGISPASVLKSSGGSSGLNSITNQTLGIFPNPASQFITINEPAHYMEISDISGRIILSISGHQAGASVDISQLSPGLYLVKAQNGSRLMTARLVKE